MTDDADDHVTIRRPDPVTLNAVERVLQLAERMLQQDRASLGGPQITLEMVRDIPLDEEAIDEVNNFFSALSSGDSRTPMDEPYCRKCNDTMWVCENHPDQEGHKCANCNGAAMPCTCHPAHGGNPEEETHAAI
jgi:hypothetical protein